MATVLDATQVISWRAKKYEGDERIPNLLILAEEFMGSKIPSVNAREYAKALQVLHWLTLEDQMNDGASGIGAISAEKEGELQIKYQNPTGNMMYYQSDTKSELTRTSWGLELYAFMKRYYVPIATRFS
jgi:hypothetical protein